jgi:hypothetical protein
VFASSSVHEFSPVAPAPGLYSVGVTLLRSPATGG